MSLVPPRIGISIGKWLAEALGGPKRLARPIAFATLTIAETLLGLVGVGPISDIRRLKEAFIAQREAEADANRAEAQQKMAEATDAANRVSFQKRSKAIKAAEERLAQAEAAKAEAEAEAIRSKAETERIRAVAHAKAELLTAISKLNQEGGQLFVDPDNLSAIIRGGLPAAHPREQEEEQKKERENLGDDPAGGIMPSPG